MQTELPKADPPKRKRRWFQFSLRSLMIVVTLLAIPCGWLAHQARVVEERKALRSWLLDNGGVIHEAQYEMEHPETSQITWIRILIGDHTALSINFPYGISKPQASRMKTVFPEAAFGFMTDYPERASCPNAR
ncbi:MAG TPA: hypothetical protein VGY55_14760 [Pirellulales bacterium]|jgi:hypothetical protein|nr:hypothetical protein [Pirellulales bacterium]